MPQIKHATIGALVASLVGTLMGLLLWAKQLDYHGPSKHIMRVIGMMGLGLVTVGVAVACLSIAFLQYLAREREEASWPRRSAAPASPAAESDRLSSAGESRRSRCAHS